VVEQLREEAGAVGGLGPVGDGREAAHSVHLSPQARRGQTRAASELVRGRRSGSQEGGGKEGELHGEMKMAGKERGPANDRQGRTEQNRQKGRKREGMRDRRER
jgi:hypothetical protein